MNKKRTNYLIVVLNLIAIISFYVLYFTSDYLMQRIGTGADGTIVTIPSNLLCIFLRYHYSESSCNMFISVP